MAKAGMKRPDAKGLYTKEGDKKKKSEKNEVKPVPEIQGKAKTGN